MPYRVDICCPPADALDTLVRLGALDVETAKDGIAAILPDGVMQDTVAAALGLATINVSPAMAHDDGSVWLLRPGVVRVGHMVIASSGAVAPSATIRLIDSGAFGTGHHPTTALCLEALQEIVPFEHPASILDVGTGSGILAIAALRLGVAEAMGLDIDADALWVAAENAKLNNVGEQLRLTLGGPASVEGAWALVIANVLPAPLIDMAPVLVRRISRAGRLVLSGIPCSLEAEVRHAYQHFGMRYVGSQTRAGWTVLTMQASW